MFRFWYYGHLDGDAIHTGTFTHSEINFSLWARDLEPGEYIIYEG